MSSPAHAAVEPKPAAEVNLAIGGMTCASCANRVERALKKQHGVAAAAVNLAAERATVLVDPRQVTAADLVEAVVKAGYQAEPIAPEASPEQVAAEQDTGKAAEYHALRQ